MLLRIEIVLFGDVNSSGGPRATKLFRSFGLVFRFLFRFRGVATVVLCVDLVRLALPCVRVSHRSGRLRHLVRGLGLLSEPPLLSNSIHVPNNCTRIKLRVRLLFFSLVAVSVLFLFAGQQRRNRQTGPGFRETGHLDLVRRDLGG